MPARSTLALPPETLEHTAFLAGYWRDHSGVVLEWLPRPAYKRAFAAQLADFTGNHR